MNRASMFRFVAITTQPLDLHRIEDRTVVDEVTAAGLRLVGQSNPLRNSSDDHTKVVVDPTIKFKTDQFLSIFRKP